MGDYLIIIGVNHGAKTIRLMGVPESYAEGVLFGVQQALPKERVFLENI